MTYNHAAGPVLQVHHTGQVYNIPMPVPQGRQNNGSSDSNLDGANGRHSPSRISTAAMVENSNFRANACGTWSVTGPFTHADAAESPSDKRVLDDLSYQWESLTDVDQQLIAVYGDTIHLNDGCRLSGRIKEDGTWQQYWAELTALPAAHYHVPSGK
eukprot:3421876-Ditylum_brightwellii.AAC.1